MWANTVVLGDLHFGERDSSIMIMEHQKETLDEVIEFCINNKIKKIIQTGDLWDVRRSTTTKALHFWKTNFFDVLLKNGIELYIIIGNHDAHHKNTLIPNTVTEHVGHYPNIHIFEEPTELDGILFVPWICEENKNKCMDAIKTTECNIVLGHFEINGAIMVGSTKCEDGLPPSVFNRFDLVISGHFHIKNTYGNIEYVGTPYELSWNDYGSDKGFHILNGTELSFNKIDKKLHYRFTYNEDKDMSYVFDNELNNKHVKLIIERREDFKQYESFLHKLQNKMPYDLKIIEPLMDLTAGDSIVEFSGELKVKNTTELIEEYVRDLYPEKINGLTTMMLSLHTEARNL